MQTTVFDVFTRPDLTVHLYLSLWYTLRIAYPCVSLDAEGLREPETSTGISVAINLSHELVSCSWSTVSTTGDGNTEHYGTSPVLSGCL